MIVPNIGLRCQLVWYPDFPERKAFDEDAMVGTFPHWITGVIPSSIDSQGRTVGRGSGTYMQKNEKLTIVGDQRQKARLLYVVHNVGIQNKASKEPSIPIRNRRSQFIFRNEG